MAKRVSVAPVQRLAKEQGINSAIELAKATGLNRNTARRWWLDDATIARYEANVIVTLAEFFSCSPGDLFELAEGK